MPPSRLLGDPPDGLEVAGGRGRETGLDHVDVEARQLAGDLELLGRGQAGARRLLAVAEGRVEDPDVPAGDDGPGGPRYARRSPGGSRRGRRRLRLAGRDLDRVEERHLAAQARPRPARSGGRDRCSEALELLAAGFVLRDPAVREGAVLDVGEDLPAWSRGRRSSMIRGPLTRSRRTRRCR